MTPLILAVALAILPQFQLSWKPSPSATSYELVRLTVPDYTVYPATDCSIEPCSVRVYAPPAGVIEQFKIKAIRGSESALSLETATLLTIDWSNGNSNYSTFDGNGAMPLVLVRVMLPTQHWTLTYSYQGAIPIYVKATCDFDYNHNGKVNLIDFVLFMPDYIASGRSLSLLGSFSMCYQLGTREWENP